MVELRGLMINRLVVLLQVFIFPAYFYLWAFFGPYPEDLANFFFWRVSGTSAFGETGDFIILKIVAPLIFALPFTLASLVRATKVANSYELMWRALGKVRIDTKLFYMVNAIFCLFFFILPFGAPIIAVFGAFFAVKLLLYAFGVKKSVPAILIVIPGLLLAAIPLMVTIAFYASYSEVIQPIWVIWAGEKGSAISGISEYFYGVVLCLACAMAIGNFFVFLREGASQVSYTKQVGQRIGIFLKAILFTGILLLYIFVAKWDTSNLTMFIINGIAIGLSGFETLVRWRKKAGKENGGGGGGTLMVPIFISINFIAKYWNGAITFVVALSACIFFVLFVLAYRYAEDETLFE